MSTSQGAKTNSRKIIGFDMDGVIVDHTDLKILLARDRGFSINRVEAQGDVVEYLIPKPIWKEIQYALYDDRKFALSQPLMPGVVDVFSHLQEKRVPYFLISRRKNPDAAIELLTVRGLWPTVFNSNNAFFVLEKEDKNTKAIELGITHYIDDEPSVLEKLVNVPNKFLFDPYEAHSKSRYLRLRRWSEFMRHVD